MYDQVLWQVPWHSVIPVAGYVILNVDKMSKTFHLDHDD